ncbi:unnamed protein product [Adineta steineri]|uniref:Uncharacterized protein n=1 Tax=Adineta steineri TaxID=433720 RepID=A0A814N3D9_9BILA|nr:unnamed protein product [Adineta steineri]CAF1087808.1 unnamed protein product [Adineta steineri]
MEPPIMNYSGGPGMYPPTILPSMPPSMLPPPMPYPNQGPMSVGPSYYEPPYSSRPRRRPTIRVCRRPRRSRRCRPTIRVIESRSSSCSSLSSYTTVSSCSPRRHRSRSCSRRCGGSRPQQQQQQQQQQPIILLPMPCQQQAQVAAAPAPVQLPVQNQIQQQPQQIILPPIRIQQQGQYDQLQQQQIQLPQMAISQGGGQFQQQPFTLPPIQLAASNFVQSANSSPMMVSSGQPMIQPSLSLPQIATITQQPQQLQQMQGGGTVQYIQAVPQSTSSQLQYVSAQPRSTIAPQRVLVNSTNKKDSSSIKQLPRSNSTRDIPQNDLKFGRRPFDWYGSERKKNIVNENLQVGRRRSVINN